MTFSDISDEFHMWLGYCIANWAKVEELLFGVFHEAIQSPLEPAAIVYYRSPTVAVRLGLTDELVLSILPRPGKKDGGHPHSSVKEWSGITKQIAELLSTRGRLAHGLVTHHGNLYAIGEDSGGFSEVVDRRWAQLHLTPIELLRQKEAGKKPLMLADLKQHVQDTEELRTALHRFRWQTLPRQKAKLLRLRTSVGRK